MLSLFPGADLLGRAFEEVGFCVVRGPELLLGQDSTGWHVPAGTFEGVIGGPPCQRWSQAANVRGGSKAPDLIPDFVRLAGEAAPDWLVMENLLSAEASPDIPSEWAPLRLCDWDCGGATSRRRTFWLWPGTLLFECQPPERRKGCGAHSLMASDGRRGRKGGLTSAGHSGISTADAAALQGFPELAALWPQRGWVPRRLAVHYLGNGVPRSMGLWVARAVARWRDAHLDSHEPDPE